MHFVNSVWGMCHFLITARGHLCSVIAPSQTRRCCWLLSEPWTLNNDAQYASSQSSINLGDLWLRPWMERSDQLFLSGLVLIPVWRKEYLRKGIVRPNTMLAKRTTSPVGFGRAVSITLAVREVFLRLRCPEHAARSVHLLRMEISLCELCVFFMPPRYFWKRRPSSKSIVLTTVRETENPKSGPNGHPWGFKVCQDRGINC